jgi:hypothetical protein
MNKEFIPYEQALEIKELGFDEPCLGYYHEDGSISFTGVTTQNTNSFWLASPNKIFTAPLYQQAFRWFRERYLLHHEIACGDNVFWFRYGKNGHVAVLFIDTNNDNYYPTYEEAELACLKKLIEITKKPKQ